MDDSSFVQKTESIQQLLRKHSDQGSAQATELILLYELIEIHTQELEDKT